MYLDIFKPPPPGSKALMGQDGSEVTPGDPLLQVVSLVDCWLVTPKYKTYHNSIDHVHLYRFVTGKKSHLYINHKFGSLNSVI